MVIEFFMLPNVGLNGRQKKFPVEDNCPIWLEIRSKHFCCSKHRLGCPFRWVCYLKNLLPLFDEVDDFEGFWKLS